MTTRFRNLKTQVVVSVADAKADRFANGAWEIPGGGKPKPKKSEPAKSEPKK